MRNLLGAVVCLIAAVLLFLECGNLQSGRIYNLDLTNEGIGDTYLIPHRLEADRCFVVDRRDATLRRSDDNQPGRKWQCYRLSDDASGSPTWMVRSKRKGKGTVFLVPASDVQDWSYPFLYGFVREHRPELELPKVEWTQLFVNRLYEGLYLRVELPFDARKKDGGSGVLREILSVQDDRLSVVNSRFEEVRGLFNEAVALAKPPVLGVQPDALVWLAMHQNEAETIFLMSSQAPYDLRLLPLPLSLPRLFAMRTGRPPVSFEDARYRRWQTDWRPDELPSPFDEAEGAELAAAFDEYTHSFTRALKVDGERSDQTDRHSSELLSRQSAALRLGLPVAEAL